MNRVFLGSDIKLKHFKSEPARQFIGLSLWSFRLWCYAMWTCVPIYLKTLHISAIAFRVKIRCPYREKFREKVPNNKLQICRAHLLCESLCSSESLQLANWPEIFGRESHPNPFKITPTQFCSEKSSHITQQENVTFRCGEFGLKRHWEKRQLITAGCFFCIYIQNILIIHTK